MIPFLSCWVQISLCYLRMPIRRPLHYGSLQSAFERQTERSSRQSMVCSMIDPPQLVRECC